MEYVAPPATWAQYQELQDSTSAAQEEHCIREERAQLMGLLMMNKQQGPLGLHLGLHIRNTPENAASSKQEGGVDLGAVRDASTSPSDNSDRRLTMISQTIVSQPSKVEFLRAYNHGGPISSIWCCKAACQVAENDMCSEMLTNARVVAGERT